MPSVDMSNYEFNFGAITKGILFALVLSLLLSTGAGLVYHFSSLPEHTLPWSAGIILACSAFCGAFTTGKRAGNKGLYHGLAVGILFFFITWIAAALFLPGQADISLITKFLVNLLGSALGGIIGVGMAGK
ncbi:MAG: TIGR04086 family membrane protein [Desulfotomaculaceae bacterium]|nr:TIGR04086 family membrane protein [Desulfotomaculaceae bacterium]